MLSRLLSITLLSVISLLSIGCGSEASGPKTYRVTGSVTFDGAPLEEGDIHFDPATGTGTPDSGKITKGNYDLKATPGPKKVRIVATRVVPGKQNTGVPGTPVYEDYIPAKYNTKSDLKADIKADGENKFDYPLTSK